MLRHLKYLFEAIIRMKITSNKEKMKLRLVCKAWYGMEISVWNMEDAGMVYFKNGMEDDLPYFHTKSILDFALVCTEKYIRMSGSDK